MSPAIHAAGKQLSNALEHVPEPPQAGLALTLSIASIVAKVAYVNGGYSFASPLVSTLMDVMPTTMLAWDALSRARATKNR